MYLIYLSKASNVLISDALKFVFSPASRRFSFSTYIFLIRDIQDDGKYQRRCLLRDRYRIPRTRTRKHLRSDYSGIFAGVFKFPAGSTVIAVAG